MNFSYIRSLVHFLCLLAAGICLIIGAVSYFHNAAFVRGASRVQGMVVRVEEQRGHDGGSKFLSIFEFRDAAGTSHTIRDSVSSRPASHAVGDSVSVLFDPATPDTARLDSFPSLWGLCLVMMGLGVVSLFFSLALFIGTAIYRRMHMRRSPNAA